LPSHPNVITRADYFLSQVGSGGGPAAPLIKPSTFLFTFKTPSRLFSPFFFLLLSFSLAQQLSLSCFISLRAWLLFGGFFVCPFRSTTQIELILARSSCQTN
jgi:hypothetical protein